MGRRPEMTPRALAATFAGVVLLTEQHVPLFIESLLPNLGRFVHPFDELIVVASGLRARSARRAQTAISRLENPANVVFLRVPLGSVGKNRNIGLKESTSTFTSFLDSDDLFRPDYVDFIKRASMRSSFDILLHSGVFLESYSSDWDREDYSTSLSLEREPLENSDFVKRFDTDWWGSPESMDNTGLWQASTDFVILQGHMTLRTKLPMRFHENPIARNEDGVFLNQSLIADLRIVFYPVDLSAARVGTSSRPTRYRLQRLSKKWRFGLPSGLL